MPERFKRILTGIPAEMQRSVLEGISFQGSSWGNGEAWGWEHSGSCQHPDACEHVCVAAVNSDAVLVLNVKKWNQGYWSGHADRWEASEEPRCSAKPTMGQAQTKAVDRF